MKLKRIYLDSNILLAKIVEFETSPKQNAIAELVFNKIKTENIEAMISPLTLMEVKSVLQSDKGKDKEIFAGMEKEERIDYVLKETTGSYNQVLGELLQMKSKVIFKVKKQIDMGYVLTEANLIIDSVRGKVKTRYECRKCGTDPVTFTTYKALATYDAFHVLLAKGTDCDEFWTFDGDFNEIENHQSIQPLRIRDLHTDSEFKSA